MSDKYSIELLNYINKHPGAFHVVEGQRQELLAAGYTQLFEGSKWNIEKGGRYFVVRNASSLIAFRIPGNYPKGFMITASHSDSPCFRIKESQEFHQDGKYTKLNVEMYGGALLAPWFDRPLSVAGRVFVREGNGINMRLVNIPRDLVLIPSLAVHMNRQANSGQELKVQKDLLPLFAMGTECSLKSLVADELSVEESDIISEELYVYNRQLPAVWGAKEEFISSPRLDNTQCAFASLKGLLLSEEADCVPVHVVFDNEEIGSCTRQGAASGFLEDTLRRIAASLNLSNEEYLRLISNSFMLSADNAHAMHPNYPEKCDPVCRPLLGGGVVIKHSGNMRYATDGISAAIVQLLAEKAGARIQHFYNHSDIPGGTTLGNISMQHVAIKTADIGIAQLAMHSPYETCGNGDTDELVKLIETLYSSVLEETGYEAYELK